MCFGVSRWVNELTQKCFFDFDRNSAAGDKVMFLRDIRFYFRVVGFTYISPLPEVDNSTYVILMQLSPFSIRCKTPTQGSNYCHDFDIYC